MASQSRSIRIMAVSGSLRQVSSNTSLLEAAIGLSPPNVEIVLYRGLSSLPHFNPDLEPIEPPTVTDLRQQLSRADGLIISTPEYAHGIPGVLKNALDWLVSGSEFVGMPIALFNASPRAGHAQASLTEIVTTMAGKVVPAGSITVPLLGKNLNAADIIADGTIAAEIQAAISAFVVEIDRLRSSS
jgi:chromate reductase, NAD(P)H dehydrogenase (quinone)